MSEISENNQKKYNQIFCETFNVPENMLNEKFTFRGIDAWDSIAHFQLISNLEDAFDIMFDTNDILHYESYLNGIEILKKYGVEFS